MIYASNEGSDLTVHPYSLARDFAAGTYTVEIEGR